MYKHLEVTGLVYHDKSRNMKQQKLYLQLISDERGKFLSIDNGEIMYTIPFDVIAKFIQKGELNE